MQWFWLVQNMLEVPNPFLEPPVKLKNNTYGKINARNAIEDEKDVGICQLCKTEVEPCRKQED